MNDKLLFYCVTVLHVWLRQGVIDCWKNLSFSSIWKESFFLCKFVCFAHLLLLPGNSFICLMNGFLFIFVWERSKFRIRRIRRTLGKNDFSFDFHLKLAGFFYRWVCLLIGTCKAWWKRIECMPIFFLLIISERLPFCNMNTSLCTTGNQF